MNSQRRTFLVQSLSATAVLATAAAIPLFSATAKRDEKEPEVTATEDLMREHGIIRRALVVYAESAPKLRAGPAAFDPSILRDTARLFRTFGENYHEKLLEEQHIFPTVRRAGGQVARYTDILTQQHARGREITDYVVAVTASGAKIGAAHAQPLAAVLDGFVRMYESHAAREDTIVFPAWKTHFNEKKLDELADQFEEIEHKTFGRDGFDEAAKTISGIERRLGIADLSIFTPPPPPKA